MAEIHKIRIKHYEGTKKMSPRERIKWLNKKAEDLMKKFGLNLPLAKEEFSKIHTHL